MIKENKFISKRILSLALAFCMVLTVAMMFPVRAEDAVWGGSSDIDTDWDGAGTFESPYLISTGAELAGIASMVNAENNITTYGEEYKYRDKCYKLTENIILNDKASNYRNWGKGGADTPANTWTPIGTPSNPFNGTFDGDEHTVSGIYINDLSANRQGLFGFIAGTVKNLGVIQSYIKAYTFVGGVVGSNAYSLIANGSIFGTITNCYNTGDVSGVQNVGGVVGTNCSATMTNCYNTGDVSSVFAYSSNVGGVAGMNPYGTITNCYNTGDVSGVQDVGGVVGNNLTNTGTFISIIANCYSSGNVSGTQYVGGVAGGNANVITNCYWRQNCVYVNSAYNNKGTGLGTLDATCLSKTDSYMKSSSFLTTLNTWVDANIGTYPDLKKWKLITSKNGGYPTFVENSKIPKAILNFDKYSGNSDYKDIIVEMTLNDNTVSSIQNVDAELTSGYDYSISNETLTINKDYLSDLNIGTAALTFNFSQGAAQTLNITISDTTPAKIMSVTADEDTYMENDNLDFTVTFNEDIIDTDTPILTFDLGGKTKTAAFEQNGSNSGELIFRYEVQKYDYDIDGIEVISLSGTITDDAGSANLTIPNDIDLSEVKVDATTAPDKPTIVSVTAKIGKASIVFDPPDNNGGLAITKYIVYAYLDDSDTAEQIADGTESSIEVTGLTNGVVYTFKVTATNGKESEFSDASSPLSIGSTSNEIYSTGIGTLDTYSLKITKVPENKTVEELRDAIEVSTDATFEILMGTGEGEADDNYYITSSMVVKVTAQNGFDSKEYGIETIKIFTVIFDSDGGTSVDEIENVIENETISEPTDPTRKGYTFDGWYNDEEEWNFVNDKVTEDIILTAQWTKIIVPVISTPTSEDAPVNKKHKNTAETTTETTIDPNIKTISVIQTLYGFENANLISIEPIGEAFDDSVEVWFDNNTEDEAIINQAFADKSLNVSSDSEIFALDISIYIKGTNTKIQPNEDTSVIITIPIPASLLANKENIVVVCLVDGKLQVLPTTLVIKNGVYCVVFTASHFSPYAFMVDTDGKLATLAAGAGLEDNVVLIPKNGIPYLITCSIITAIGIAILGRKKKVHYK